MREHEPFLDRYTLFDPKLGEDMNIENNKKEKLSLSNMSQRKSVFILRFLYPVWAIVGFFSLEYVFSIFIVDGDVIKTAENIIANTFLFNLSIVSGVISDIIYIISALLLFKLFKKVHQNQAALMVLFALVGATVGMVNTFNRIAALLLLENAQLMMVFLNLNKEGVVIASVFWGLWLFPLGYLTFRSGYFPKIIGVFLTIGGVGYLLAFFIHFLLPMQKMLLSISEALVFGEIPFMLWIIIRGAKLPVISSRNGRSEESKK